MTLFELFAEVGPSEFARANGSRQGDSTRDLGRFLKVVERVVSVVDSLGYEITVTKKSS